MVLDIISGAQPFTTLQVCKSIPADGHGDQAGLRGSLAAARMRLLYDDRVLWRGSGGRPGGIHQC